MKRALITMALSTFVCAYLAFTVLKQSEEFPDDFDFKHLVTRYEPSQAPSKKPYKIGSSSLFTELPEEKLRKAKNKVYLAAFIALIISIYPAWKAYKKEQFYK